MPSVAESQTHRALQEALIARLLEGNGCASHQARRDAFDDALPAGPLGELAHTVTVAPTQVTDAQFEAARAQGASEDEIFEVVICAAVGQATRQYRAALDALDKVIGERT